MLQDTDSPLIPIKPRNAFIKNSANRASFCGVVTAAHPYAAGVNRKSWCGENESYTIFETPELGTFKGGGNTGGTFPRKSKAAPKGGLFTPTGNEVRRFCGGERRYAEVSQRSSTISDAEPPPTKQKNLSSDSDNERSTEDDEKSLLTKPNRTDKVINRVHSRDTTRQGDQDRLNRDEVRDRRHGRIVDIERCLLMKGDDADGRFVRESLRQMRNFPHIDLDESSINQSGDSLSSGGDRGDCSSSPETSCSSVGTLPGEISVQERLLRTHPVWFLPGIHRAGAFHLLQGKEEGSFIVRQSSQPDTLAISVRLPRDKGPYIEHYLIQNSGDKLGLETSQNKFASVPELITHYAQCCDELPIQLTLPRALRECETRQQLNTLALLGQEFWRYPEQQQLNESDLLLNRSIKSFELNSSSSSTEKLMTFKSAPKPPMRPNTLSLATTVLESRPTPPPRSIRVIEKESFVLTTSMTVTTVSPATTPNQSVEDGQQNSNNNCQKLNVRLSPEGGNSFNKSVGSLNDSYKLQTESPDLIGSNSITSGIFSPTSQNSKGCFSPDESQLCSPISSSGIFSPLSEHNISSPLSCNNNVFSNSTNRSRRSKRTSKNESKHYQETDILNSPDVYCRSSLQDKISDYEDIWQSERDSITTFKPTAFHNYLNNVDKIESAGRDSRNGVMLSKRPDLLPDTLPKLAQSKSIQSLHEKEPLITKDDDIGSSNDELIATTNSKGEIVPRRPNRLDVGKLTTDEKCESISRVETPLKSEKQSSPFYSEPVDALVKNTVKPVVQRRKLLKTSINIAQRYSEPPTQPYKLLHDLYSSQNITSQSPNELGSTDSLIPSNESKNTSSESEKDKMRPKWTVDSSWEFIDKQEDTENSFPSEDETEPLTIHRMLIARYPEVASCTPIKCSPRASSYDNVPSRPHDELASENGTVFSEPWDSSKWHRFVPQQTDKPDEMSTVKKYIFNSSTLTRKRNASMRRQYTSAAGITIKEYALKLSRDQTSTFARHIHNFIMCTLNSKERCPEVMMRNMRQFMSGMKNYLVKHGEKEFSKEVEKERQKLQPTEFLNLDTILEEVMVECVIKPLKRRLYTLLVESSPRPKSISCLTPQQLGLESDMVPPEDSLNEMLTHLRTFQETDSPLHKLDTIIHVLDIIVNTTRCTEDDTARVLSWMWGLSDESGALCESLALEARALSLAPASELCKPRVAQALATLHRAAALLHATDRQSLVVVWPDETTGRLTVLRPHTGPKSPLEGPKRALSVARAAAAHAAVTHSSQHALYLLEPRNGQIHETMLSDNEIVDEMMAGKRCILAYKRIDSKIAWPHNVFDLATNYD